MKVRLADLDHKLPVPGSQRLFSRDVAGEDVDLSDSFWAARLRDGSVVAVADAAAEAPAAPAALVIPPVPALAKA